MDISLRVLRHAVAVADHGSFTAAAEALYVTQPSLSRQMRQLEQELRITLFQRVKRGIVVTERGKIFLDSAREAVDNLDYSIMQARNAGRDPRQGIRVGINIACADRLTPSLRAAFAAIHPDVRIQPKTVECGREPEALRDGLVDIGFMWLPNDTRGLTTAAVAYDTRVAGLPVGHPLAAKEAVTLDDLRDEPLLWIRNARILLDWWLVNPRPDGSEPVWGAEADCAEELLEYVAAGEGVCFSPGSAAARCDRDDVVFRPILGLEDACFAVAMLSSNKDPVAVEFMRTVVAQSRLSVKESRHQASKARLHPISA